MTDFSQKSIGDILKAAESSNESGKIDKIKTILRFALAYLTFAGIFSFAVFIAQEGCQLNTFANFPAMDAGRYDLVRMNLENMQKCNRFIKFVTKYCLWLVPPQQRSYEIYSMGVDTYIETHRQIILAKKPGVYEDERVSFEFSFNEIRSEQDKFVLKNGPISVFVEERPRKDRIHVTGVIEKMPGYGLVIDLRDKTSGEYQRAAIN